MKKYIVMGNIFKNKKFLEKSLRNSDGLKDGKLSMVKNEKQFQLWEFNLEEEPKLQYKLDMRASDIPIIEEEKKSSLTTQIDENELKNFQQKYNELVRDIVRLTEENKSLTEQKRNMKSKLYGLKNEWKENMLKMRIKKKHILNHVKDTLDKRCEDVISASKVVI